MMITPGSQRIKGAGNAKNVSASSNTINYLQFFSPFHLLI